MAGALRNFFSGLTSTPVAKAVGDASFGQNKPAGTSLAQNPSASGYDVSYKPVTTAPTGSMKSNGLWSPSANQASSNFQPIQSSMAFKPVSTPTSDVMALQNIFGKSDFAAAARGNVWVPSFDQTNSQYQSASTIANLGGSWSKVDALNTWIQEASATHNVDPNMIKAIMKLESGGEWIISHAGAVGYMQVVPKYWGDMGYDLNDPRQNILAGAKVFKHYLDQYGGDAYEALRHYHGIGFDGFTTDTQYADAIMANYKQLTDAGGTYYGSGNGGLGGGWNVMFGGSPINVSQEFGMTEFAAANMNGMYAYAPSYGVNGHPGVDVAMPRGSTLRSPVSGTVIRSGGSGYYCDTSGCGPGIGELKLKLENGDELILGHMSRINVTVGQRVTAGQPVGLTGTQNGDHVHVEYRTPDSSTSSGWRAVDPRGGSGVSGEIFQERVQTINPFNLMNPVLNRPFSIPNYAVFGYQNPVNYMQQWSAMRSGV